MERLLAEEGLKSPHWRNLVGNCWYADSIGDFFASDNTCLYFNGFTELIIVKIIGSLTEVVDRVNRFATTKATIEGSESDETSSDNSKHG